MRISGTSRVNVISKEGVEHSCKLCFTASHDDKYDEGWKRPPKVISFSSVTCSMLGCSSDGTLEISNDVGGLLGGRVVLEGGRDGGGPQNGGGEVWRGCEGGGGGLGDVGDRGGAGLRDGGDGDSLGGKKGRREGNNGNGRSGGRSNGGMLGSGRDEGRLGCDASVALACGG